MAIGFNPQSRRQFLVGAAKSLLLLPCLPSLFTSRALGRNHPASQTFHDDGNYTLHADFHVGRSCARDDVDRILRRKSCAIEYDCESQSSVTCIEPTLQPTCRIVSIKRFYEADIELYEHHRKSSERALGDPCIRTFSFGLHRYVR